MRVISFNANGLRAAARNGFFQWVNEQNADFICIQETKAQEAQLVVDPIFFPKNYHCAYHDAEKKGYSGVAIFARHKPTRIVKGIGYDYCDKEGRYIQFDYPKLSVVSLYLPSGTSGEGRQAVKYAYLARFEEHLLALKKEGRSLILCGDYNIAHKAIDLKNWKSNQKNSGFLPEERAWMDKLFGDLGFIDAFRVLNQEAYQYSWWSYRQRGNFDKNIGWRIDYQVITPDLISAVKAVSIHRDKRWSDHAPVRIDYEGKFCD